MKPILCSLALLCLIFKLSAQDNNPPGLSIGDKVPDITISNILNHPTGEATLSDYLGQWLILDFWATWCSPCIAMFPKTDSLQQAFEGEVTFLSVTYEEEGKVNTLFNKLNSLQGLKPIMAVEDTKLQKLFPHRSLPHYVWINPEGVVAAITGMDEVTGRNIEAMLQKKATMANKKAETTLSYDRKESLLTAHAALPGSPVRYHSAILDYVEGLKASYTVYPPGPLSGGRLLALNLPLPWLYRLAYSGGTHFFGKNRMVIEIADMEGFASSLGGQAYEDWLRDGHGFCYEVTVPPHMAGQEYEIMQQDMARYFPQYQAKVETRKRPVLALVKTSAADKIVSHGGKPQVDMKPYGLQMQNMHLGSLVMQLNVKYLQHLDTPLVDQTGYKGKVDLDLDATLSDVASLREALQAYGLDLVGQEAEIEVLVIGDTEKNNRP